LLAGEEPSPRAAAVGEFRVLGISNHQRNAETPVDRAMVARDLWERTQRRRSAIADHSTSDERDTSLCWCWIRAPFTFHWVNRQNLDRKSRKKEATSQRQSCRLDEQYPAEILPSG
jgi:hypothetical protein